MSYTYCLSPARLQTQEERLQCTICEYLLSGPLQLPCGHRICTPCARKLKQQNAQTFFCKKCKEMTEFIDYFYDKVISKEIDYLSISCPYDKCNWTGEYRHFQNHVKDECQMVKIQCPNKGCSELFVKRNLDKHLQQCEYRMVKCQWCKQDIRYDQGKNHEEICKWVYESCTHCQQRLLRQEMQAHLDPENYDMGCNQLQRCCLFKQFGCKFKGSIIQLNQHESNSRGYHSHLIKEKPIDGMTTYQLSQSLKIEECRYEILKKLHCIEKRMNEVDMVGLNLATHDGNCIVHKFMEIKNTQLELKRIMCGNTQFASIFNQLKPCYSLVYLFKIKNLTYCIHKAKNGHYYLTEEICTGPRGYTIAYLIYLNGEKTKESWDRYVSIYLLIKQGGYFDKSLQWPFTQPLMLTLLMNDMTPSCYQMIHKEAGQSVTPVAPLVNPAYKIVSSCVNFIPIRILSERNFIESDCLHLLCNLCG